MLADMSPVLKVIVTKVAVISLSICIKGPVLVAGVLTECSATETLISIGYLKS